MEPDSIIHGYSIQDKIGGGGMATVYRAVRLSDHRLVALKQLHPHIAFDARLIERFTRGAEIMMELHHPNIAEVYEYFKEGDSYYQAEEFLSGGSLADYRDANPGPVDTKKALTWCRQALIAIDYAHQQGVLHRDLKPGNLMLDAQGNVKVTDFGIAKVLGSSRVTVTGVQLGTPDYMSPEQIRDPNQVTHLTDVYSMGVVLFEFLTGRLPFAGKGDQSESGFEISRAVVQDPPPRPRSINPAIQRDLEQLILRALEKTPSLRYGGGAEFAAQIDQYLNRGSRESWFWPLKWRRPVVFSAAGIVVIFLIGIWIGSGIPRKPAMPQGTLTSKNGVSVRLEPTNSGDRVWVSKGTDNVIDIDLIHSRITVAGFTGIIADDGRPADPNAVQACRVFLDTKAALEDARAKSNTARDTLVHAIDEQAKAVPAPDVRKQALARRSAAEQEEARAEKTFVEAAQQWLDLKSAQPCPPKPQ